MEMILFIGIPGSGKSSFYKENFFNTHLRVNLDMLRTRKREAKLLHFCVSTSMKMVIDNTNVTLLEREKYIQLGKKYKFKIIGFYFRSDLEECIDRNSRRSGKEKIPERGVRAMYKKLKLPVSSEGFDELYYVRLTHHGYEVSPFVENEMIV